jgi:hypothetical protein
MRSSSCRPAIAAALAAFLEHHPTATWPILLDALTATHREFFAACDHAIDSGADSHTQRHEVAASGLAALLDRAAAGAPVGANASESWLTHGVAAKRRNGVAERLGTLVDALAAAPVATLDRFHKDWVFLATAVVAPRVRGPRHAPVRAAGAPDSVALGAEAVDSAAHGESEEGLGEDAQRESDDDSENDANTDADDAGAAGNRTADTAIADSEAPAAGASAAASSATALQGAPQRRRRGAAPGGVTGRERQAALRAWLGVLARLKDCGNYVGCSFCAMLRQPACDTRVQQHCVVMKCRMNTLRYVVRHIGHAVGGTRSLAPLSAAFSLMDVRACLGLLVAANC